MHTTFSWQMGTRQPSYFCALFHNPPPSRRRRRMFLLTLSSLWVLIFSVYPQPLFAALHGGLLVSLHRFNAHARIILNSRASKSFIHVWEDLGLVIAWCSFGLSFFYYYCVCVFLFFVMCVFFFFFFFASKLFNSLPVLHDTHALPDSLRTHPLRCCCLRPSSAGLRWTLHRSRDQYCEHGAEGWL